MPKPRSQPSLGARRRVQAITVGAGVPPPNVRLVVGLTFAEGTSPPDIEHVSSATYSLGSPTNAAMAQIAVLSYSLASPSIPPGLKRVAILPET